MNGSAWIHTSRHAHVHTSLIYLHMYTSPITYKTLHLAQTDQADVIHAVFSIARFQHFRQGHEQYFGACGSAQNLHATGAISTVPQEYLCPLIYAGRAF